MAMIWNKFSVLLLGAALCLGATGHAVEASEIYQWTDENGVVHYSQWAPEEDVGEVQTVRVEGGNGNNGLGISEQDDPEGYRAHQEEMDALWTGIEERREAARSQPEAQPVTEYIYVGNDWGYEDAIWPVYRPWPQPPNHRPRPPRPRPHDDVPYRPPGTQSVPYRRPR